MARFPQTTSIKTQRDFWAGHDAIEVFGERGWIVSEPGTTSVKSVYVARVGAKGAVIRVPREWLALIGAGKGRKNE